ncbi:4-hydroxy-tetrahydrodipicolinate reductase [Aminiphilus circumscriptus]|jgi:4-hydroxy-tetrahydrodipicolinate reductase|uniref:4-hydroxy-tetrahydrodipicolinate reductase n=1 Tax=Aminiphilus circumscriptus TaxID=290732 RepID=UPI0004927BF7|nr:4-hydroxy-tetrahydrodipicolinate reductase [Aminiphilus circumscriptus]
MTIKVFVSGASGNVGRSLVRALAVSEDLRLAGGWCREAGKDLGTLAGIEPLGITASGDLAKGLETAKPDLVIDFTSATILMKNLECYAERGLIAVVGTTGLDDENMARVERLVAEKRLRWAVIPNFGLGINLVLDFLEKARKFYPYVTILDRHPATMANAPSGTAAMLAKHAAATGSLGEVQSREIFKSVLGGNIDGVPVHSERLPVPGGHSEHEITLARKDEIIRIEVRDFSSDVYVDGVFLVARTLPTLPPGTLLRSLREVS